MWSTMKYHQRHHEALKEWILIILMHSRIDSSIWNTMFRAASHCTIMKETFRKTLNFPRKRLNFLRASQVYVQITPCIKSRLKEWVKIYVERDPIVISTVNNNRNNNRIVRVVYAKWTIDRRDSMAFGISPAASRRELCDIDIVFFRVAKTCPKIGKCTT